MKRFQKYLFSLALLALTNVAYSQAEMTDSNWLGKVVVVTYSSGGELVGVLSEFDEESIVIQMIESNTHEVKLHNIATITLLNEKIDIQYHPMK